MIDTNLFIDITVFSMVGKCQIVIIHVGNDTKHFMPRAKLNFPFTGVAGDTPCASVHSPGIAWTSESQKRSTKMGVA